MELSRVHIPMKAGVEGSDYINASFLQVCGSVQRLCCVILIMWLVGLTGNYLEQVLATNNTTSDKLSAEEE